ncbi:MAG: FtsX-like permease family protein, partial [candidate division Zixibacteria bacterium]|nr:FtsX-like permease family protein [candidate division Zixibacteria bacterium]
AVDSLRANKARSVLTMLGIIIGVGAVITMISLGQGAKNAVQERINALGSNLLFVRPGPARRGHIRMDYSNIRLTMKDIEAIKREVPGALYVVPEQNRRAQVKYLNRNWNTYIQGTTPDYRYARNAELAYGEYFTATDVEAKRQVCVIGKEIVTQLFEDFNPIGETMKIRGLNFEILGVLEERGATMFHSQDDIVLIPITTGQKRVFGYDWIESISVSVLSPDLMDRTAINIERVLRRNHRIPYGEENDFHIRNQTDIVSTMEETSETFTALLASIALVSLLVGGIGIMNIMLVSVTERTREIGIRKAIGARRKDILLQFITEAISLSLVGGCIGVFAGIGGSLALSHWAQWNTLISGESIVIAFLFSGLVGIFFGIYPAARASKLDPIDALRYE